MNYSKKAQLKIQQMAFVIVILVIFFAMVTMIYLSFQLKSIETSADNLRKEEAIEIVRSLATTPEFLFSSTEDCLNCVDLDKILMLKINGDHKKFWNLDYLIVERVFPRESIKECTKANYPDCTYISIIPNKTSEFSSESKAFVTLVRWVPEKGGYFKHEVGIIHVQNKK